MIMQHGKKNDNTNHLSEFMLQKDKDSMFVTPT